MTGVQTCALPISIVLLKQEFLHRRAPLTHGGVLGQVWREGTRQANLARLVPAIDIIPLDANLGARAGRLLGKARRDDVIDAALVLLAADGDMVLTSDARDLEPLAAVAGLHIDIVSV